MEENKMNKYNKGDKITIENSVGQKITWVATGDEQRDSAISIQVTAAAELLTWQYGSVDMEGHKIDCSGLTSYLYSLTDTYIGGNNSHNQYNKIGNNLDCDNVYSKANGNFLNEFDLNNLQTGDIITFEYIEGSGGGHVAYYLGDGYFIHAANSKDGVIIGTFLSTEHSGEKFKTKEGMEVTGAGDYWGKHVIYASRFDNNIYVDDDTIYHTTTDENGNKYIPTDKKDGNILYKKINSDGDIIDRGFFKEDKFISSNVVEMITTSINATPLPQHEKDRLIEQLVRVFTSTKSITEYVKDKNYSSSLKEIKNQVIKARTTRYDPLILDLDGDGFNVEKKEFGANFDLDKNGFAEKINWTSRYNLKRKRVFDIVS